MNNKLTCFTNNKKFVSENERLAYHGYKTLDSIDQISMRLHRQWQYNFFFFFFSLLHFHYQCPHTKKNIASVFCRCLRTIIDKFHHTVNLAVLPTTLIDLPTFADNNIVKKLFSYSESYYFDFREFAIQLILRVLEISLENHVINLCPPAISCYLTQRPYQCVMLLIVISVLHIRPYPKRDQSVGSKQQFAKFERDK